MTVASAYLYERCRRFRAHQQTLVTIAGYPRRRPGHSFVPRVEWIQ
jgi:hypothetical protein